MEPVLHLVAVYGYAAIFFLLVTGIVGLPVPDEWLMVFSGYLVYAGKLNGPATFAAALAGSLCGTTCSYWIGRRLGARFIRPRSIEGRFGRIGDWLLFVGYYIPGVRHFTALSAGASGLEFRRFAMFAYSGAVVWVSVFLWIGYHFGERWRVVLAVVERNLKAACLIGGVGLAGWLAVRLWRRARL